MITLLNGVRTRTAQDESSFDSQTGISDKVFKIQPGMSSKYSHLSSGQKLTGKIQMSTMGQKSGFTDPGTAKRVY